MEIDSPPLITTLFTLQTIIYICGRRGFYRRCRSWIKVQSLIVLKLYNHGLQLVYNLAFLSRDWIQASNIIKLWRWMLVEIIPMNKIYNYNKQVFSFWKNKKDKRVQWLFGNGFPNYALLHSCHAMTNANNIQGLKIKLGLETKPYYPLVHYAPYFLVQVNGFHLFLLLCLKFPVDVFCNGGEKWHQTIRKSNWWQRGSLSASDPTRINDPKGGQCMKVCAWQIRITCIRLMQSDRQKMNKSNPVATGKASRRPYWFYPGLERTGVMLRV